MKLKQVYSVIIINLLYHGLTVPLGFARSEEIRKYQDYDYGYEHALVMNLNSSSEHLYLHNSMDVAAI